MALTKVSINSIEPNCAGVGIYSDAVAFSSAGEIIPDLSVSKVFTWAINGNKILNVPTINPGYGFWYIVATNDGTGGYTLTFNADYNVIGGTYNQDANKVNLITISSNGARCDVWIQVFAS
jgi:hypothetical protein